MVGTKFNAWANRMTCNLGKAGGLLLSSLSFSFNSKPILLLSCCSFLSKSFLLGNSSSLFFGFLSESFFFCDTSSQNFSFDSKSFFFCDTSSFNSKILFL